jgi:hypothetical protein
MVSGMARLHIPVAVAEKAINHKSGTFWPAPGSVDTRLS